MPVTILGPVAGSGASLRLYSSKVSAGFPSPAQDHLEREISLDEILQIRAPHTYLVRAGGDSMIRAGIHDGDLMVVDRSREAEPGDIVIAAVNGEPTVKRLAKDGNQVVLRAENPGTPQGTSWKGMSCWSGEWCATA